ncbi:MAG: hypothetical protein HOV77_11415 [Hamadaea sp.]|uniref:nucleotidyltransferase family protein n=1 Tax=Hamadaea sp. TaxID=2024425 RepID=UPI00179E777B|nr:nucleotidyltransferase family protein [Hamadaea sp.]NUT19788.1 hypothetical protein [Hamadaea sp.]
MLDEELDLLIALCDPGTDDAAARVSIMERMTAQQIDWNRLFILGLWHKVAFLALQRLMDLDLLDAALESCGLPLLLLNHWKQLHRVNLRRNELLQTELGRIVMAFQRRAVPYAVGKGGPLLIGPCYRPSERKMYDLDFLAPRDAFEAATAAMAEGGYVMGRYGHSQSSIMDLREGELRKWLLISRGLPNFIRKIDDVALDISIAQIQFRIGSTGQGGRSIPADPLIANAAACDVGWSGTSDNVMVARPSMPDTFLQLALHIVRETTDAEHRDWGMSWNLIKLCDLDRFVRTLQVPTHEITDRAIELGFATHCRYALEATFAVFPGSAPVATLLARFRDLLPAEDIPTPTIATIGREMAALAQVSKPADSSWTAWMGVKTT